MAVDDPLIGKSLGDYTIQSLLGRGGMSRVYKGYDENLDRYAAVKVISGDFATTSEEEYTRRFQTEARAIARLRHENIVGVYQFGRTEGIYYMAQVFLEGKDLRSLMKSYAARGERIPKDETLRIVDDITRALDYAHEQGVIHRDIKPSNIMLEKRTGRAILMDFGLALSVHEGTMGDTFGSAHYIAPEQAISSAKSVPQSDLYSLGVVIYEMLTGKVPFDDPSVMSVALKHLNELPPPPTLYNPELSGPVEHVVMRLLDKEPTRRYANGRQLHNALVEAFERDHVPADVEYTPVMDMLASHPSPPDSSDPSWPGSAPESGSGEVASGVAGRFARHKERKEREAAIESGEGLQIDEAALSSILAGYADPSELEAMGNNASSVPHPRRDYGSRASQQRRSRRLSGVLSSIVLLAVLIGAAWLGLGLGDRDNNSVDSATGTLSVAALDRTATAEAGNRTASSTPADETPTGEPTDAQTQPPTATVAATATATARATSTAAPSATPSPAPSATPQPSPTATDIPASETPEPSPTDIATESPTDAPTEVAVITITETVVPVATEPDQAPNIRLQYSVESPGQGQFLLINLSTDTLDVSQLVFERERSSDGMMLRYEGRWWDRAGISASPNAMPGLSCFQLVTTNGTYRTSSGGECPMFLGYYRTNIPDRYFWLAQNAGATFTVRYVDTEEPLVTCPVEAGVCEFYIDTSVGTGTTATETPGESASQSDEGVPVRLLYDANSFLLINPSEQTLDVSTLSFEQAMADGSVRRFEASQWDRPGIIEPPSAMIAGSCYQLVPVEGAQSTPSAADCAHFLGWFSTSVSRRYFWLSNQPGAIFTVKTAGSSAVLAACEIDAGECTFLLPAAQE